MSKLKYLRVIAGVLLVTAALVVAEEIPLPIPKRAPLALMLFGAALTAAVIENILPIPLLFPNFEVGDHEMPAGIAARLWGMILVSIGLALSFGGLVAWFYPGWLENYLLESPKGQGLMMVMAGMLILLRGVIFVIGSEVSGTGFLRILANLPGRIYGVILLLLGLGLLGVGWFRITAPGLTSELIHRLIPPIPTPPIP